MKTMLNIAQFILIAFAVVCMWYGMTMIPGIAAILVAIWLRLIVSAMQADERAHAIAMVIASERGYIHGRIDALDTQITTLDSAIGSYDRG